MNESFKKERLSNEFIPLLLLTTFLFLLFQKKGQDVYFRGFIYLVN